MEKELELMGRCSLLRDLSRESLDRIRARGRVHTYQKGAALYSVGDRVEHFYILLSGTAAVCRLSADGAQSLLEKLTPGAVAGAELVCTKTRLSPCHVLAGEETRVLLLPADCLLQKGCLEEGERLLAVNALLRLLSDQNLQKEYRLAILTRNSIRERITVYLTMQAARLKSRSFTIPFDREELAAYLSVNRSALSHELSKMGKEGLLRFHKNSFTITGLGE